MVHLVLTYNHFLGSAANSDKWTKLHCYSLARVHARSVWKFLHVQNCLVFRSEDCEDFYALSSEHVGNCKYYRVSREVAIFCATGMAVFYMYYIHYFEHSFCQEQYSCWVFVLESNLEISRTMTFLAKLVRYECPLEAVVGFCVFFCVHFWWKLTDGFLEPYRKFGVYCVDRAHKKNKK